MSFVAVVSDTGPLHYLVLLEQVELLNRFFGEILVPSIVLAELNHERTPIAVRDFISSKPTWLKECFTPPLDPRYSQLGSGESRFVRCQPLDTLLRIDRLLEIIKVL